MPVTIRVAAKQLPSLSSFSHWDSVELVRSAISSLESTGYMEKAALVVDAMGRDDRISGVMLTRAGALPALPLRMEPRGDGRQKSAVAREAEDNFEKFFPDHTLTELLHWGTMLGVGLGQLVWKYSESRWEPLLRVWHPRFIRYDFDREGFEVHAQGGPIQINPGDGQWLLYCPWGIQRGWMHAKVRSLHVPWLLRQWAMRDWARSSEVHGNPMKLAMMPSGAQQDDKERFITELANVGSEAVVALPRVAGGSDNDNFDVKLLEAATDSHTTFKELIAEANTCIAISLLGQNLTTEVKGGSYAAAVMHQLIRNDVLQSDAERLGQCLREQALSWWAAYNFGDKELAPMPIWRTTPSEDKKAQGEGMKAMGDGVLSLKSIGAKPDIDTLLEEAGVPVTGKAEDVPMPTAQTPGQPATGPDGQAPAGVTEGLPRPTQRQATASQHPVVWAPCANHDCRNPVAGEGTKWCRQHAPDIIAQLRDLNPDVPAPAIEGQMYVDDVGTAFTKAGAKAMASDLADLLHIIDSAEDFTGLRGALLTKYGKMSKAKLARLMEQALVLSELAGRHSVLEELAEEVRRAK